ncbi:MAG: DUF4332 domain-containing protein [Myxococcales bacterium]|nr:DUF4332 domain-containing protein [Myxococcales bacterium]
MSYTIDTIEGIGPTYRAQLEPAGIKTTDDLLDKCGSASGRDAVSASTQISTKLLLKWANMADLMRIKGVAGEYAELLEAAGVDTIKELRHRKAENLAAKMEEVNAEKKLTRQVPSASVVAGWVEQAKAMEPRISH